MKRIAQPLFVLSLAVSGLVLSQSAAAVTYAATADFSVASNPNGVWSYGYSHEGGAGYAMTLFDLPSSNSIGLAWQKVGYVSAGTPDIFENTSSATYNGVAPGQLSLHPGPSPFGDFTILRFTAPSAGAYDVTGQFFAGDIGNMNGGIVLEGDLLHPLEYFASTTNLSIFTPLDLTMAAGETLDFVVGNNGNYLYGSTPVTVDINSVAAVPEPSAMWMLLAGLGALGVALRRRASL